MEQQRGIAHLAYSLYMLALGRYRLMRHYRWLVWWRRAEPDQRRRARDRLFVDLVAWAARMVPMYRALYANVRLERLRGLDDLERLPLLTRAYVRSWPLRLRRARFAAQPPILPASTSGSGGTPLRLYRSLDEVLFYGAELLGYLEQWGIPASAPLFFILFNADPTLAYNPRPTSPLGFLRSVNSVDVRLPLERISTRFDQYKPALVITHPSTAEELAGYRLAIGRPYPDPILFALGGEMLSQQVSHILRRAFPRRRLVNIYNTVETGLTAWQTVPSDGSDGILQLNPTAVVAEMSTEISVEMSPEMSAGIDADAGAKVGGTEDYRQPIFTNLRNRATPFIRYSGIEDLLRARRSPKRGAEWASGEIDQIVAIDGRRSERVYSPDRRSISVCNLMSAHADLPGVIRFQYVQAQPAELELRYRATAGADHRAIAAEAARIVRRLLGQRLRFSARAVDQLERPAGSWKTPPLLRS